MEKVQKLKRSYYSYLFYGLAMVAGAGLGILFSQNVLFSEKKQILQTEKITSDIEKLSSEQVNQMIAERANLIENTAQTDSENSNLHPQKILNPIEIEQLNRKVRNFDLNTKAGEQNADKLIKITWEMLKDVKFEERYYEEVKGHLLYPVFGESVKKIDGKMVYIRGFVIPADEVNDIYVLSANSYSSCFFCGNAGPESVMDLELKMTPELKKQLKLDAVFTFKGKLKLNATDIDHLNYILEDAQIYDVN